MDKVRYDIVERPGGWLLTDNRQPPRAFLSSFEAIGVAKAEARARPEPSEIHIWRDGVSVMLYPLERSAPS